MCHYILQSMQTWYGNGQKYVIMFMYMCGGITQNHHDHQTESIQTVGTINHNLCSSNHHIGVHVFMEQERRHDHSFTEQNQQFSLHNTDVWLSNMVHGVSFGKHGCGANIYTWCCCVSVSQVHIKTIITTVGHRLGPSTQQG